VEEYEFMPGDVFGLDIFVSSGEGKTKEGDFRTTVYKRELDVQYNLKSTNARAFFNEVNKKYPTLPFSIRAFENSTTAKVGVKECLNHDLLTPYPILIEKPGEYVAQFKCTIAVQQRSTVVLASGPALSLDRFETDKKILSDNLKNLIAGDLWKKEDKKKSAAKEGEEKEGKSIHKNYNSYSSFIYKVLKQVHPDTGISNKAMAIMNSFVGDIFERIATEAGRLARYNNRQTITSREIQTAVRLLLPGELAKHAVSEGTKAVTKYNASLADE